MLGYFNCSYDSATFYGEIQETINIGSVQRMVNYVLKKMQNRHLRISTLDCWQEQQPVCGFEVFLHVLKVTASVLYMSE